MIAETPDPEALLEGYRRAEARRRPWEPLWRDCAAHALPYGTEGAARIYDATAADASDQLAASLLAELTPPFQRWVGFEPGSEAGPDASETLEDGGGHGAGPSRPLRLRGRDAPGAARPGGARHGLPAVRGKRARPGLGLPLHRRAADGDRTGGGPGRPARPGVAKARARARRAPRPVSPRARLGRGRAVRRGRVRGAGGWRPPLPQPCWRAAAGGRRRCWPRAGSPSRPLSASAG